MFVISIICFGVINALLFPFGFRARAVPFRDLSGCVPIVLQIIQAVAMYAFCPFFSMEVMVVNN